MTVSHMHFKYRAVGSKVPKSIRNLKELLKQVNISMQKFFKDNEFKFLCIGDSGVGKTSLIDKLRNNNYLEQREKTIGFPLTTFKLWLNSSRKKNDTKPVHKNLKIWDATDDEAFRKELISHITKADALLIFFDVTNKDSFNHINQFPKSEDTGANKQKSLPNDAYVSLDFSGWLDLSKHKPNIPIFLIGTKADEERQIKEEEVNKAIEYWRKQGFNIQLVLYTSAKNNLQKDLKLFFKRMFFLTQNAILRCSNEIPEEGKGKEKEKNIKKKGKNKEKKQKETEETLSVSSDGINKREYNELLDNYLDEIQNGQQDEDIIKKPLPEELLEKGIIHKKDEKIKEKILGKSQVSIFKIKPLKKHVLSQVQQERNKYNQLLNDKHPQELILDKLFESNFLCQCDLLSYIFDRVYGNFTHYFWFKQKNNEANTRIILKALNIIREKQKDFSDYDANQLLNNKNWYENNDKSLFEFLQKIDCMNPLTRNKVLNALDCIAKIHNLYDKYLRNYRNSLRSNIRDGIDFSPDDCFDGFKENFLQILNNHLAQNKKFEEKKSVCVTRRYQRVLNRYIKQTEGIVLKYQRLKLNA